jgi:hypothetical protein
MQKMSVPDALTAKLECLFNFSQYLEEWPEPTRAKHFKDKLLPYLQIWTNAKNDSNRKTL